MIFNLTINPRQGEHMIILHVKMVALAGLRYAGVYVVRWIDKYTIIEYVSRRIACVHRRDQRSGYGMQAVNESSIF